MMSVICISYLFSGQVGWLTSRWIINCSMKRHLSSSLTISVIHFITLCNLNLVHFNRAARFTGHENLGGDHLSCEWEREIEMLTDVVFNKQHVKLSGHVLYKRRGKGQSSSEGLCWLRWWHREERVCDLYHHQLCPAKKSRLMSYIYLSFLSSS